MQNARVDLSADDARFLARQKVWYLVLIPVDIVFCVWVEGRGEGQRLAFDSKLRNLLPQNSPSCNLDLRFVRFPDTSAAESTSELPNAESR